MSATNPEDTAASGDVTAQRVVFPSQGGRLTPWVKGQSGNPGGNGVSLSDYNKARAMCAEVTPDAIRKQIKMMDDPDSRVAFMATEAVINRGVGKPRDHSNDKTTRIDLSGLSVDDQRTLADLLRKALGV
jgi:hypothetical protein